MAPFQRLASDIAVVETSDLNSNVMIEMGVALTWGTRVPPIRRHDAPPPPSDISGQVWETGNGLPAQTATRVEWFTESTAGSARSDVMRTRPPGSAGRAAAP